MFVDENCVVNGWMHEVEIRFSKMDSKKRAALPLHEIIKQFKEEIEKKPIDNPKKMKKLAERIFILSQEKMKYYSSTLGFIIHFFSCLRNIWKMGVFKSSALLGLELSHQYLSESPPPLSIPLPEPIEPSDCNGTIENPENINLLLVDNEGIEVEEQEISVSNELQEMSTPPSPESDGADQQNPLIIPSQKEIASLEKNANEKEETPLKDGHLEKQLIKKTTHVKKKVMHPYPSPEPTPKQKMMHTFETIWEHASPNQLFWIENIWSSVIHGGKILSWQKIEESQYQLELKNEISGKHPKFPGLIILKQKMKVTFSEEFIPETNQYKQKIVFLDEGLCYRFKIGFLPSKDIPAVEIAIEEKESNKAVCHIKAPLGMNKSMPAGKIHHFWNQVKWVDLDK